jgi:hypothetical protein
MNLQALRRKAAHGSLEVEHILKAAKLLIPGLSAELTRLSAELHWSMDTHLADGTHVGPMARWAAVASAYADHGLDGLGQMAHDDLNAPLVIGMLEEINSSQAVDALLRIFASTVAEPTRNPPLAFRLVKAVNLMFSVKSSPASSPKHRKLTAAFLNEVLGLAETNAERALVMYAMRGAGDTSSIDLLAQHLEPEPPYVGARALALKAIRKRQRDEA